VEDLSRNNNDILIHCGRVLEVASKLQKEFYVRGSE
jgi:hypothetical protein